MLKVLYLQELKEEAATCIQRALRQHIEVDESKSNMSQGTDHPACCRCGIHFGAQTDSDYEGDACDICASYFHTSCLHTLTGAGGERLVCDRCEQAVPEAGPEDTALEKLSTSFDRLTNSKKSATSEAVAANPIDEAS